MKLDIVGGNSFEQSDRFVGALVSLFGESDQEFGITRLGQELALPLRLGELFEASSARPIYSTNCVFHAATKVLKRVATQ